MKILLYANGSSRNHGCEAIKKTTTELFGENEYYVGTTDAAYEDPTDGLCYIPYTFQKKYSILQRALCRLRLMHNPKGMLQLEQFRPYFQKADMSISVGGDNYCYGDSDWLYYLHSMAIDEKQYSVLWGASVEADLIDDEMLEDLAKFDRIVVRESLSFNALKEKGLGNVMLCPDPAFALKAIPPKGKAIDFKEGKKHIGINISPLVERKEAQSGVVFRNYQNLVQHILANTDYEIVLIPHMVTPDNNDYELLKQYKEACDSDRILLLEDMSCENLKYCISKCAILIAARTHASIAAYSQCIPTLVIGYSVKSRGIATDLFGTTENYVIPIDAITGDDTILHAYQWIEQNQDMIRNELRQKIPGYVEQLYQTVEKIKEEPKRKT